MIPVLLWPSRVFHRVSLAVFLLAGATPADAGQTALASVDTAGNQAAGGTSFDAALSGNGRFIAFTSGATNLVDGDSNGFADVFVHDRKAGGTSRASVDSNGQQADGDSGGAALSASGRFVAFESFAGNLADTDAPGSIDVFVHDRKTGETVLVSVDADGNGASDDSDHASISANGRWVAFESLANDLVAGDTNGQFDVFVRDLKTATTVRASVSSAGAQATGGSSRSPALSANGRFVAFQSEAADLVPGDTNALQDVFVHDLKTGVTTRESLDSAGLQVLDIECRRPALSASGRIVAFASGSASLVAGDLNGLGDVFTRDRKKGLTSRVSVGPDGLEAIGDESNSPSLSASGRFVAFESGATNLVIGDTNGQFDVYLHDRSKGKTTRLSVSSAGDGADADAEDPSISSSGKLAAFESLATNLVAGDVNSLQDVFLRHGP